jgi:hypothetical protein
MLSRSTMGGMGLDTDGYESGLTRPPVSMTLELAQLFNRIVSDLIRSAGVTQTRHLQMVLINLNTDDLPAFLGCNQL